MTGSGPRPYPVSHVFVQAGGNVPQSDLDAWAPALQAQLREDLAPEWCPFAVGDIVRCDSAPPAPGEEKILLLDEPPDDEQGVLAEHDKDEHGIPLHRIYVGAMRRFGASISRGISHELNEGRVDPEGDAEVTLPDGRIVALEVSDQVQETGYQKLGVDVSNFNGRANYGLTGGSGRMDFLGLQKALFQVLDGGYEQVLTSSGWQVLTSERVPYTGLAAYHAFIHSKGLSRRARRAQRHLAKRARIENLLANLHGDAFPDRMQLTGAQVHEREVEIVRMFLNMERRA